MPLVLAIFILFSTCFSFAQEIKKSWLEQARLVIPGQIYIAGGTVRELAEGKGFGQKVTLTVVGELPSIKKMSEILNKLPGIKRRGTLYSNDARGLLSVDKSIIGQYVVVRHESVLYRLNFVDSIEGGRSLYSFNVNRALLPMNLTSATYKWDELSDPERGIKNWMDVDGRIETKNWDRALADPLSWALQWATLIVEQNRGAKMTMNLPGPSMDYVIEQWANGEAPLTEEQKESFRSAFAHPKANQIFVALQHIDFFKRLISHHGAREIMSELKINPWRKQRNIMRSCRQVFFR